MISSKTNIWDDFTEKNKQYRNVNPTGSFYFCDNKEDADICAQLVVDRVKQATATSLWWFEKNQEKLPQIGDLNIITNWDGTEKAIIETTKVEQVTYNEISSNFAKIEGEGDQSLTYWKKIHWAYYSREMKLFGEKPTKTMIIVCEYFKTIWTI